MPKKPVSKKVANEGRGRMCRDCMIRMNIQLTIDGYEDLVCPKCGRRWELGRENHGTGNN
jgi:NMD protein affecting ribosome stability and mRNA decay